MSSPNFGPPLVENQPAHANQNFSNPAGSTNFKSSNTLNKHFISNKFSKNDLSYAYSRQNQMEKPGRVVHRLNMIASDQNNVANFTTFSSESLIEFERWVKKFKNLVQFYGKKWDEADKLAKLATCLDGTPMRIFEGLEAAKKATMDDALKNIRDFLDSPQRRELTYQALANCKQEERESVQEFLNKFIPLIQATTVNFTDDAKQETFCRALLDKLKPEIGYLLKATTLGTKKQFDTLCIQAQEAEIMIAGNPKASHSLIPIQSTSSTFPNEQPNYQNSYPQSNQALRGPTNSHYHSKPNQSYNYRSRSDRWNAKPFCEYCNRAGHTTQNCYFPPDDFQQQDDDEQQPNEAFQAMGSNAMKMLNDLATQVHELQLKF